MPKTIQLRNIPDAVHRKLKKRAAAEGLSLSDFLIREFRRVAERPTQAEMRRRLATLSARPILPIAAKVAEERD